MRFGWWPRGDAVFGSRARPWPAGLQRPKITGRLVPVFTGPELSKLERACAGRSFTQRRDAAIVAVFKATGIRLSELAGIRYDRDDARRSDIDLWQREITVRGKGARPRSSRSGMTRPRAWTATSVRARHARASRPQL
jgi:site-specific recombinase XerC